MLRPIVARHSCKKQRPMLNFTKSSLSSEEADVHIYQSIYVFPNGFGASVVYRTDVEGREVAVLDVFNKDFNPYMVSSFITYDTYLTGDVLTGLSSKATRNLLKLIEKLERK